MSSYRLIKLRRYFQTRLLPRKTTEKNFITRFFYYYYPILDILLYIYILFFENKLYKRTEFRSMFVIAVKKITEHLFEAIKK